MILRLTPIKGGTKQRVAFRKTTNKQTTENQAVFVWLCVFFEVGMFPLFEEKYDPIKR